MGASGGLAARYRVVIAGGGVAALEAALTLREVGAARVATTLLTPQTSFVHRPLNVLEPFPGGGGRRYELATVARSAGARLCRDALASVDTQRRVVYTAHGQTLHYDGLLLAYGSAVSERFRHARTVDDEYLAVRLRGIVQDVEDGYVRRVAFVAAPPLAWPLPLYELALMTSRAAYDTSAQVSVFLVTPEDAPLEVFGDAASRAVSGLLRRHHVEMITAPACQVPAPGKVEVGPDRPALRVQSVVAMPELAPRPVTGVPAVHGSGFIEVDEKCRVVGLPGVYAAGDATAFPVKHGSIAALQADTAAIELARLAGAEIPSQPFRPVLEGMLLGGDRPLYLTARLNMSGRPLDSAVSDTPPRHPTGKIGARRLGRYLHHADQLSGSFSQAAL